MPEPKSDLKKLSAMSKELKWATFAGFIFSLTAVSCSYFLGDGLEKLTHTEQFFLILTVIPDQYSASVRKQVFSAFT